MALASISSFAQEGSDVESRKEKIEAMKVSFITKKMNLTPEEARAFWPVYNQYENELELLRKNHRRDRQAAREDFSAVSDREIERMVDAVIAFRQGEVDILKKYHALFKQVLPVKKVAMLYKAEDDFKKELLRQVKSGQ